MFLLVIVGICVIFQLIICPKYEGAKIQIFAGVNWYNPYDADTNLQWQKAIFHAHCKAWAGITNGKGTAQKVHETYDSLGFGIHSVSNYFSIDTCLQSNSKYISAYEHGTGINRTHQLILGSKKVVFDDYLLPQTFNNKQHILNKLSADTNNVVIINHPSLDGAYRNSDMQQLQNYDCMEVLNPQASSFVLYDAALSAGRAVFMVANDDNHDVAYTYNLGNYYTCIPQKAQTNKQILQALKKGNTYVVESNHSDTNFPKILQAKIVDSNYIVQCNTKADSIFFIGQNGKTKKVETQNEFAKYTLQKSDTYIRVKLVFPNKQTIYLNPIFRFEKLDLNKKEAVTIKKTWFEKLLPIAILALIIKILLILNNKKK